MKYTVQKVNVVRTLTNLHDKQHPDWMITQNLDNEYFKKIFEKKVWMISAMFSW